MKNFSPKMLAVTAKGLELRMTNTRSEVVSCLRGGSKALCATTMILGLLVAGRGACAQIAEQGRHAEFEPASVYVPAGNDCTLHPADNADPSQSIALRSDADGVVRFLAVRATLPPASAK